MFTKKEIRCLEFVNKYECGYSISGEDLNVVAYTDLAGFAKPFFDAIIRSLFDLIEEYGEYWSDYDKNNPNDSFHEGYKLDGKIYITWYTGDEGCYWNKESDRYTICRPW